MRIKTKHVLLAGLVTVLANTQIYAAQDEYLNHMLAAQEASKTEELELTKALNVEWS